MLFADDHKTIRHADRSLLTEFVGRKDYGEAEDGEDAMATANYRNPYVVILGKERDADALRFVSCKDHPKKLHTANVLS